MSNDTHKFKATGSAREALRSLLALIEGGGPPPGSEAWVNHIAMGYVQILHVAALCLDMAATMRSDFPVLRGANHEGPIAPLHEFLERQGK